MSMLSGFARSRSRGRPLALLTTLALGVPLVAGAQDRLVGVRTFSPGVTFDSWRFAAGLYQPTVSGADSVRLDRVTQWSVPVAITVPLGQWNVDLFGGYASGTVTLASPDRSLGGATTYELRGLTDTKLRLSGPLGTPNVLLTLGLNLPTGMTKLSAQELSALRVLAAPALAVQVPSLGTGRGATAGLVYAREIGGWAWALGASYDYRGDYSPATVSAGIPTPDFNPGDIVHLSAGLDGLIGESGMTLGVSADLYTTDRLAGAGVSRQSATRLGPIFTVDWQLRVATTQFRELTLYAIDRYRSKYERGGVTVARSSGNYLDAGVRSVLPVAQTTGLLAVVNFRHQTGLASDSTIATAGLRAGGLTLGLSQELGGGYALQPFVRGQIGRIKVGARSSDATGLSAGVRLDRRF